MLSYLLELKASAEKDLERLDNVIFSRVDAKVLSLATNPRPAGCKKLKGYGDLWRIRVGDWRVIYSIR